MQLKKAFFPFLSTALLFVIAWFFLFFSQAILETNANDNINYIPENATFALRIDGRELAEKSLFSIFLESKDQEVLDLMQEAFDANKSKERKWKNYGIDYLTDVVVFQVPFKGKLINGYLFNVTNGVLFLNNMPNSTNVVAYENGVGIVFPNPNSIRGLEQFAKTTLHKMHSRNIRNEIDHHASGRFFEMYLNSSNLNKNSVFAHSTYAFQLDNNDLLMSGDLIIKKGGEKALVTIKKILKPKGLHVSTTIIPLELKDTLNSWLKQFGVEAPDFKQISMNYMGTTVINHTSGFFVIPQMELLVECDKPFNIESIYKSPELSSYFDFQIEDGSIRLQDERLYIEQISPTSFYIGITKHPKYSSNKENKLVEISGDLSALTEIKCGGLMESFLGMIPQYRAGKQFTSRTEKIAISLVKTSSSKVHLSGDIHFKTGFYPMNELLKALLIGQAIN